MLLSRWTFLFMSANFLSSMSIIWVNKWLFVVHKFLYPTTLTFVHFLFTSACLYACLCLGVFSFKPVPVRRVVPLVVSFCGFVVLTNLSLQLNSVGTCQILKALPTPMIIAIQRLFYGVQQKLSVQLSMIPIVGGSLLATTSDFAFNMPGFLVGLLGAISTALYYTWVGTLQSDLEVSSLQLLMYQAPLSALFLIPFAPILDDFFSPAGLLNFSWTNDCLMLLFISGCLSFFVNVSMYLVIGSTSPISYQVLGYFKHIFTVTGGMVLFQESTNPKNACGIVLSILGIVYYSHAKVRQ